MLKNTGRSADIWPADFKLLSKSWDGWVGTFAKGNFSRVEFSRLALAVHLRDIGCLVA